MSRMTSIDVCNRNVGFENSRRCAYKGMMVKRVAKMRDDVLMDFWMYKV